MSRVLVGKQFEILHELVPSAAVVGFLVNPKDANAQSAPKCLKARRAFFRFARVKETDDRHCRCGLLRARRAATRLRCRTV